MRHIVWILLALIGSSAAFAGWKTPREELEQREVAGVHRIYYTLEGDAAFPANAFGVERHERAKTYLVALTAQLAEADRVYRETLGLKAPFDSSRYAKGRYIDWHIMRLEGKSGSAGDELHVLKYRHFETSPPVLLNAVTHRWTPEGLTPAHELFHSYQYAYTYFKNSWYLEGMARASESYFRSRTPRTEPLPANAAEIADLLTRSYRSDGFWNRLTALCGPSTWRVVLETFGEFDRQAARDRKIDPTAWPEDEQRSDANNRYMLRGLRKVAEMHCPVEQNAELRVFRDALKSLE